MEIEVSAYFVPGKDNNYNLSYNLEELAEIGQLLKEGLNVDTKLIAYYPKGTELSYKDVEHELFEGMDLYKKIAKTYTLKSTLYGTAGLAYTAYTTGIYIWKGIFDLNLVLSNILLWEVFIRPQVTEANREKDTYDKAIEGLRKIYYDHNFELREYTPDDLPPDNLLDTLKDKIKASK
jgi:hypothetical protein